MTEQEWLACADEMKMLEALHGKATDRKWWLYAFACCRRVWHLLSDARSRRAVDVAESYAAGQAGTGDKGAACAAASAAVEAARAAYADVYEASWHPCYHACMAAMYAADVAYPAALYAASHAAEAAALPRGGAAWADPAARAVAEAAHCEVLRDLFGPLPFRPVSIAPACLTPQVVALAQAAYDQREVPTGMLDGARLAVLADALEDAGCDQAYLLAHLRGPGPHVRGCWVLDLLLGKG
jgi:hypothetical protein